MFPCHAHRPRFVPSPHIRDNLCERLISKRLYKNQERQGNRFTLHLITEFLDHLRIVVGVVQDLELLYGYAVFLQQILGLKLQQVQMPHLLLHNSGLCEEKIKTKNGRV